MNTTHTPYNFKRTYILTNDAPVTHNRFGNVSNRNSEPSLTSINKQSTKPCPTGFPPNLGGCKRPTYSRMPSSGSPFNTQQECQNSGIRGAKTNGCEYVHSLDGNGYLPICDDNYTSSDDDTSPPVQLYTSTCYKNCPAGWSGNSFSPNCY